MLTRSEISHFAVVALCATVAACSSPDPVAYSGIASSSYLAPNQQDDSQQDDSRHVPFRYSAAANWGAYKRVIVDPVAIYRGADQQFGDISEADKSELADYMQSKFAEKLRRRFALAKDASADTLRVKLTLTGADTNTPVLGTFTRFDIGGGLYNGVQAVRGGEGLFTGAVLYAVEIYDAQSGRLLAAFVAKQYPGAYNIPATFGSLAAAKAGIDKGADALAAQLSGT